MSNKTEMTRNSKAKCVLDVEVKTTDYRTKSATGRTAAEVKFRKKQHEPLQMTAVKIVHPRLLMHYYGAVLCIRRRRVLPPTAAST